MIISQQLVSDTIPGRPSSHCATLTELLDGSLLAVWYAGSWEGHTDVALVAARYEQDRWSAPWVIHDTPGLSDGNPLLYTLADGTILLWFVTIQGKGWDTARPYWCRSTDGGRTWSAPERFFGPDGLMFRCRPLRLASGRIIIPAYDETVWQGWPLLSDDGGETWREGQRMVAPVGCIQPALVQLADSSLLAVLRTGGDAGHLWESRSTDDGETWSPCAPMELPNPNAGIDLIRLVDGRLLLAYNPLTHGRERLAVAVSADAGAHWVSVEVENDPGREFSYPTLLQDSQGRCHLLYTYRRDGIKHLIMDPVGLGRQE